MKSLASAGFAVRALSRNPSNAAWLESLSGPGAVTVHQLDLGTGLDPSATAAGMEGVFKGAECVFFAAGFEKQEQATVDFYKGNVLATIRAAKASNVATVVVTSSGGSTNAPGLTDSIPKNEIEHWSDPDDQLAKGKFSPAAKTLMEIAALEACGRNKRNEVVDEVVAKSAPRLVIMNPNLILGPPLDPGAIKGNSLPWIVKILKKERMNESVPNDSMSIIDVRDLAALHVAAATNEGASGRYFGVNKSFPWTEILGAFEEALPGKYFAPPRKEGEDYEGTIATKFDHTRKQSLGVSLRPLKETLKDLVKFLQERGEV